MVTDCNFFLVLTTFLVFIVLLGSFTAPMESQSIHRKKIKTIEFVGIVPNSIKATGSKSVIIVSIKNKLEWQVKVT